MDQKLLDEGLKQNSPDQTGLFPGIFIKIIHSGISAGLLC
jgi:hypothetical protein